MKQLYRLLLSLSVIFTMTLGNTYAISSAQPVHHSQIIKLNKLESNPAEYASISNNDKQLIECENELEDDSSEFQSTVDYSNDFKLHDITFNIELSSFCKASKSKSLTILYCVFRL